MNELKIWKIKDIQKKKNQSGIKLTNEQKMFRSIYILKINKKKINNQNDNTKMIKCTYL